MADRALLLSLAGPVLAGYLEDPSTIEVMCNTNKTAFWTRYGQGTIAVEHPGMATLDTFLSAIAHEVGQEWRVSSPRLSAALEDLGWRIQAGRPPLAPACFLALRRHPQHVFPLADFEVKGILTAAQGAYLRQAMVANRRMLLAGGVGSAKTTLLNSLLDYIHDTEDRVIVAEDSPEILTTITNCVHMRTVKGQTTLRDLVQDMLRLNPDRVVVGEVRSGEALEMLKLGQTGHGILTTIHVDEAGHALARLEQLVLEVSATPQQALIGEVIESIVHMAKRSTSWTCTAILEVDRWDGQRYHVRQVA